MHRENAGLLALTRVGSRRVVQIAAGFMIFFSILGKFSYYSHVFPLIRNDFLNSISMSYIGKFGAVFASIPPPMVAALYCLFFAYVGKLFAQRNGFLHHRINMNPSDFS